MSNVHVLPVEAWVSPYGGDATQLNSPFGSTHPFRPDMQIGFPVDSEGARRQYESFEDLAPGFAFLKKLKERYERGEEFMVQVLGTNAETDADLSFPSLDHENMPVLGDETGYENFVDEAGLTIAAVTRSIVERDLRGLWVPRMSTPNEGYVQRLRSASRNNYLPLAFCDLQTTEDGHPATESAARFAEAAAKLREAAENPDLQPGRILPVLDMAYTSALQYALAANVATAISRHEQEFSPLSVVNVVVPAELLGIEATFRALGVQDVCYDYATVAAENGMAPAYKACTTQGYVPDAIFE